MDLVQFEVVLYFWLGLVWRGVCKKVKMLGFPRKLCQNFYQNPCSCFSYRLSYNNPNEVISIGKEP